MNLAVQCFRLALVFNNDHAEAYNNLALVELQRDHREMVEEEEEKNNEKMFHRFEFSFSLSLGSSLFTNSTKFSSTYV